MGNSVRQGWPQGHFQHVHLGLNPAVRWQPCSLTTKPYLTRQLLSFPLSPTSHVMPVRVAATWASLGWWMPLWVVQAACQCTALSPAPLLQSPSWEASTPLCPPTRCAIVLVLGESCHACPNPTCRPRSTHPPTHPPQADLFGSKYVGAIHGRFLLASSAAAVAGPAILLKLRQMSESSAVDGLLQVIEPKRFEAAFGATMDQVQPLVEAKTVCLFWLLVVCACCFLRPIRQRLTTQLATHVQVTIAKLLELAPPGTMDPTPMLYVHTLLSVAVCSLLSLGHVLCPCLVVSPVVVVVRVCVRAPGTIPPCTPWRALWRWPPLHTSLSSRWPRDTLKWRPRQMAQKLIAKKLTEARITITQCLLLW